MRTAWITILMLAAGCRADPQAARRWCGDTMASLEKASRSPASQLAAGNSQVEPAALAFSQNRGPLPSRKDKADEAVFASPGEPLSSYHRDSVAATNDRTVPKTLTLKAAIRLALQRNPDLVALRAGEPVAHAAYHVAETYPWNPQFQTQVLPYTRERDGSSAPVTQQYIIVQTFELAGQRHFRRAAAAANWDQVALTIRQAELMNTAQTMRLFVAALYQRELSTMNRQLADLNEQMVGVIERRMQAGLANEADAQLARLQAESARRQRRLGDAKYKAALMALRTQLNLDERVPLELSSDWLDWSWRPLDDVVGASTVESDASSENRLCEFEKVEHAGFHEPDVPTIDETVLRQLVKDRPDVAAARAAAAMAAQNLNLAEAMRRPNLQIGPMWQRDNSATEYWGFQGQINIPIVNTGQPLVEQRMAELRQQEITAAQLENRAVLEARAAARRYERARRLVEQSRAEFVRSIEDALRPFDDQFQAGQITLLQVFAARTTLVQSRQSFLDLLNELALAAADVVQATGIPPERLLHN